MFINLDFHLKCIEPVTSFLRSDALDHGTDLKE